MDRQRRERGIHGQPGEGAPAVSEVRETRGRNQRVNEDVPKGSHSSWSEQHDADRPRPQRFLRLLAGAARGGPRPTGRAESETSEGPGGKRQPAVPPQPAIASAPTRYRSESHVQNQ